MEDRQCVYKCEQKGGGISSQNARSSGGDSMFDGFCLQCFEIQAAQKNPRSDAIDLLLDKEFDSK